MNNNLINTNKMEKSRKKKVLIIDDKKENLDVVSFFLETHDIGYLWISEGKKALEVIKSKGTEFDLILLDLAIPEFSGIDIFNTLYKYDLVKSLTIVLFTASATSQEELDRILNSGAKGLIFKPPSLETLEEMLEKYLS